ncbi:hypothetical protein BGZ94_003081, partial [Podila epigama]
MRPFSPAELRVKRNGDPHGATSPEQVWKIRSDIAQISYGDGYSMASRRAPVEYTY